MAINKFVRAILTRTPISLYGDGNQTRDFTFVSDIIEANLCAVKSGVPGSVFNIGGGSSITVHDLILEIEKNCEKSALIQYQATQIGDVSDTLADVKKAEIDLHWHPEITIQEGIMRYIQWVMKQERN